MHVGKSKKYFPPKALRFDHQDCFNLDITLARIIGTALTFFYVSGCPAIALSKERSEWKQELLSKPEEEWTDDDWELNYRIDLWDGWQEYFHKTDNDLFEAVVKYMGDWFSEYADEHKKVGEFKYKGCPDGIEMLAENFRGLWN